FVTLRQNRIQRFQVYAADMRQAAQFWEEGNLTQMDELLKAHQPGTGDDGWRRFEWYLLWGLLHRERLILQHHNWTVSAYFTPDSRRVFTSDHDGKVETWDVSTGRRLGAFTVRTGQTGLLSAPRTNTLVIFSVGDAVRLMDTVTGQIVREFRERDLGKIDAVGLSDDGRILAISVKDSDTTLWDSATGKQLQDIGRVDKWVKKLQFSPDNRWLAAGGNSGALRLCDVRTGR